MSVTSLRTPAELLSAALSADASASAPAEHHIRWGDGTTLRLEVGRWLADPSREELDLLASVRGPVLDVGCGPGRHVASLAARGVEAVGIDVLPEVLQVARRRGAHVLERSVFDEVPRTGEWATVLLFDGNIGIGGDPLVLMRRVRDLLAPHGTALVEVEEPGLGIQQNVGRLETPHGRSSTFTWGRVGADAVDELALRTGFEVVAVDCVGPRRFARLRAHAGERHGAGRRSRFPRGGTAHGTATREDLHVT